MINAMSMLTKLFSHRREPRTPVFQTQSPSDKRRGLIFLGRPTHAIPMLEKAKI